MSVLPHMKSGGIIYVVADLYKRVNVEIRDACEFFAEMCGARVRKVVDDVVGREICHFVVT